MAVLASIFAANGSYETGQAFVDGLIPAMQLGAVVVAVGAAAALGLSGRTRTSEADVEPYRGIEAAAA